MKGFNIKKLATIAAGAALVGSAVAPIAAAALTNLAKSDVVDASGAPVVDIVVGSHAAVSDVVWAGNIAAKLAQLATKTTAVTGGSGSAGTATVTDIVATLTVGSKVSRTGAKTTKFDLLSGRQETDFLNQNIVNDNVPSLKYYGNKTYTYNNTSYTGTMQEKLVWTIDPKFNSLSSVKALVGEIAAGNLKYRVDLGSGIPAVEAVGTGAGSGVNFADDANDNIVVPFFGKDYLVKAITPTSGSEYVELVETAGEKDYKEGDLIEGLKDQNGNGYYVKVGPGGTEGSTDKVKLTLYTAKDNPDGADKQVDTRNYSTGDVTFYKGGQTFLATSVNISALLKSTVNNSTVYTATVLVGTSRVQLYSGKDYPYDPAKTQGTADYTVALTFSSDRNYLTQINIQNSSQKYWTGNKALKAGESAGFPNDYATIKFLGFQLPEFTGTTSTERVTSVTIGDEKLVYKDATYESTHTIPFYRASSSGSIGSDQNTTGSFTIDGKTVHYAIDSADKNAIADGRDTNACILTGNVVNGVAVNFASAVANTSADFFVKNGASGAVTTVNVGDTVDLNGMQFKLVTVLNTNCIYLQADGNVTFRRDSSSGTVLGNARTYYYVDENLMKLDAGTGAGAQPKATGMQVPIPGLSDINANYLMMVDESGEGASTSGVLWLLLADQNFNVQYNKKVMFLGTDINESGGIDANTLYYMPDSTLIPTKPWGGGPTGGESDTVYKSALFKIYDADLNTTIPPYKSDNNVWIDTTLGNGDLIKLPNTNLAATAPTYEVDVNSSDTGNPWHIREDSDTYLKEGYSDYGTKYVAASQVLTVTIPENRPKVEVVVSGSGSTEEVTGTPIEVAVGATGTSSEGTKVTVNKVDYKATCGAGTGSCAPESYEKVVSVGTLVYDDTSVPAGKLIIVGGHLVNTVAKGVTDDKLAAAGDKVAEKLDNGNIVVAGFTAQDTGAAAQELIDALDALMK